MNTVVSKIKTKKAIAVTLSSLVASISMCICCALPAFLLLLGGGPILAYIFTTFPKLLLLEQYSTFLFLFSGTLGFWRRADQTTFPCLILFSRVLFIPVSYLFPCLIFASGL